MVSTYLILFINIIINLFLKILISELLWVLTRKQFPGKELIEYIYNKIKYLGLNTRRLRKTVQKGCPA